MPDRVEFGAVLDPKFRQDLRSWIETDRRVALRILDLMEAILWDPFAGIGKPEPLKYISAGLWSRRITQEHRLVYRGVDQYVYFLQAKYHY